MSTATPSTTFNIAEPIPGYRTSERIGAGGYGEVWKAEAPGGIAKAIKIVYGYHDDERAARELAALNRIKEACHPFMLSLERIEMIEGHLVIVTELASSNLKNVFEEYRRQGLPGIPRAELLDHLRDAADALDYLCRVHSLQHLDVKPENLLLLGGRIKVGDFGLVKDLQDVNCSMINGLTPVYAGPELFDGRPSVHSDQYSLAIVYQEMLTGAPPFEGRTTAQLAAQHLHSRPRLDRLPASDQAAIGRALAKDPEQRFPCCRAMIDSLLEVTPNFRPATAWRAPGKGGYYATPAPSSKTEVLSRESLLAETSPATAPGSPATPPGTPAPPVRELEPLELKPDEMAYRPTVVIGIGGLAARTLQSLHARLANEFGDLHAVPAVRFLLFDTDGETLKAATEGDAATALDEDAAIVLPLRPPADYRCESSQHLQWLSRRWIYNIPRSLQTQGLRPLGRLALVDNCQRASERIERAIEASVDEIAIQRSAERTGLPFRGGPPRVFLVSSISGGTGGGMTLDMAYLVRRALRKLGLSEQGLCGILAHCSGRNSQGRDLAVANAYSFLSELYHYGDLQHAYPGEITCGLPPFPAEDAPFTHTYVVNLGEDLEQAELLAGAGKLARYVYASAFTPAGVFFDKCREQPEGTPSASADPSVRTFGLCQLGFSLDDAPAAAADELCEAVLVRWRGMERKRPEHQPKSLADPGMLLGSRFAEDQTERLLHEEAIAQAQAVGLDGATIVRQLEAAAVREMGDSPQAYLFTVLGQVVQNYHAGRSGQCPPPGGVMVVALDTLIRAQDADEGGRVCMESLLEKQLAEMAAQQGAALRQWILSLVTTPGQRVERAQRAADYLSEYLRAIGREAGELLQSRRVELGVLKQSLVDDCCPKHEWLRARGFAWKRKLVADARLTRYFQLSIEELTLNGVCRLVRLILAQVAGTNDRLRNLAADLNRLAQIFQRHAEGAVGAKAGVTLGGEAAACMASETIRTRRAELVAEMEHELEEDLRQMATTEDHDAERIVPRMRRLARAAILRTLKQAAVRGINAATDDSPGGRVFSLTAGLKAAQPKLGPCGGARRLLLVAPEDLAPGQLLEQLRLKVEGGPSLLTAPSDGVLLCYELQELALRHVAAALLEGRLPYVELASRLHTRIDVPWATL
jgi:hypothetical protein